MNEKSAKLTLKPVNDLLEENFFIPAYQRGYRWTKPQVKELLDDIWEFRLNSEDAPKEAFYCLQPIVVSRNNGSWEVVDGQQRLTTIYLILDYLKQGLEFFEKEKFAIHYESRPDSSEFLKQIDRDRKEDNIDYYHMVETLEAIEKWFKEKTGSAKINFLTTLLNDDETGKNVKVIWYDLSNENAAKDYAIDVFTRINIGKIALTNAELVKALFLGNIKAHNGDNERVQLKRLQIASEWDKIENTLQKNDFWYFIYGGNKNYDTRIEYIFDLMQEKSPEKEYYFTFHKFNEDIERDGVNDTWLKIKNFFQTFDDWFHNRTFYHYIGFLVETGTRVRVIKDEFDKSATKTDFNNYLLETIRDKFYDKRNNPLILDDLNYEDHKQKIRTVLLLFNIQSILNNEKSNIRFPFDLYKNENWNIEHIRSVNSEEPTGSDRKRWLKVVLNYFTGLNEFEDQNKQKDALSRIEDPDEKQYAKEIAELLQKENIPGEDFSILYQKILAHFNEKELPENINSISNLTLLDEATNKHYRNAPFPVKRQSIIVRDTAGSFIPLCTKNVFLKAYSKRFIDIMYWQESDEKAYLNAIKETLSEFLTEPKKE